jgi:predicted RNA-binding Zn ribbon-like protein
MHLNPYGEDAVRFAVDLLERPADTPQELAHRCREAGVVVDSPATGQDVTRVRRFLARWLGVVDAADHAERAARLNVLLERYGAHPRVTDHTGAGWHLHFRDDGLCLGDLVAALVSVGTALHLTGRGMHLLGRCDVSECRKVFADVSRTGRRRYCSVACANRDAVRRHRARAAAAARA